MDIYIINNISGENQIKPKYIDNQKKISDTLININNNIYKNISGEFYQANITENYLLKNKKLPIIYLSVVYDKPPIPKLVILKIYLYFNLESEINNLKNNIPGNFSLELNIDNNNIILDPNIGPYPDQEYIMEKINKFISEPEISKIILDSSSEKLSEFKSQFKSELEYWSDLPKNPIDLKNYKL